MARLIRIGAAGLLAIVMGATISSYLYVMGGGSISWRLVGFFSMALAMMVLFRIWHTTIAYVFALIFNAGLIAYFHEFVAQAANNGIYRPSQQIGFETIGLSYFFAYLLLLIAAALMVESVFERLAQWKIRHKNSKL